MTEQLYYKDAYMIEFEAVVLKCEKTDGGYRTVLDKTAFFPEGGGQCGDVGEIDGIKVIDTVIDNNGVIFHLTEASLTVGKTVKGVIDWDTRFSNMQNHSGEHIVSGIAHTLFGCTNVGFHLGHDDVTIDYDIPLSREQIELLQQKANEAVFKNLPIICTFPNQEEIKKIDYRSKKELDGKIRIVKIPDIDICACCAPHVNLTGEVGIIKLLDSKNYKGGVRIHMLCGFRAILDYESRYKEAYKISLTLSAKQHEISNAVDGLLTEIGGLKQQIVTLEKTLATVKSEAFSTTDKNAVVNCSFSGDALRMFVDSAAKKCNGLLLGINGNDTDGYRYVAHYSGEDFLEKIKTLNQKLNGKGGGRPPMAQGSLKATFTDIQKELEVL